MTSLLVIIFAVELVIQLINTVGAATINNLLLDIVILLPSQLSKEYAERRKLQAEYLRVRRDLNATSSQDAFAKWAKLRRQHDKLLEQLEKKKSALDATRTRFDRYLTGTRWLLTRVPQYLIPFWHAKEPMFWLPHGVFPYYAEWLLSFPQAPLGSVSIVSWQVACASFIRLAIETITAVVGLVRQSQAKRPVPMASTAATPGSDSVAQSEKAEGKKEL